MELEQSVRLAPVDVNVDAQMPGARLENVVDGEAAALADRRRAAQHRPQRTALDDRERRVGRDTSSRFERVVIDVPRVEVGGPIVVQAEAGRPVERQRRPVDRQRDELTAAIESGAQDAVVELEWVRRSARARASIAVSSLP